MNDTSKVIPILTEALDQSLRKYGTVLTLDSREDGMGSLIKREVDLKIESGASLTGCGAACQGQRTGGPWTEVEAHADAHQLPGASATFAVQTFAVQMFTNNTTGNTTEIEAVAYINNLGTASPACGCGASRGTYTSQRSPYQAC